MDVPSLDHMDVRRVCCDSDGMRASQSHANILAHDTEDYAGDIRTGYLEAESTKVSHCNQTSVRRLDRFF